MFGGKILVGTRKQIEGTYRMHAYQDAWEDSVDIEYDGELTPAVTLAICEAWKNAGRLGTNQSGFPQFRIADLGLDSDLIASARKNAELMLGRGTQDYQDLLRLFDYDDCLKMIAGG